MIRQLVALGALLIASVYFAFLIQPEWSIGVLVVGGLLGGGWFYIQRKRAKLYQELGSSDDPTQTP